MSKIELFETDGAARTLLTPLWCRAEFARRYPASGLGAEDARLLRSLRADFSAARLADCRLYALREALMLSAARRYLDERPGAALVDLGCGLDTLLRSAGGEENPRYYVDLPEALSLRSRLLPPREGERYIAADVRGLDFLREISAGDGAFFALSGLLCHLEREEALRLLAEIRSAFPGAGLAFDGPALRAREYVSALPPERELRAALGGKIRRMTRLPSELQSLPAAGRAKLALLMRTTLRFYEARID